MNKRLGTLAAAVVLTAVAEISSGITRPLPFPGPRPCPSTWYNAKPCTMPPVPAVPPVSRPPRPTNPNGTNSR